GALAAATTAAVVFHVLPGTGGGEDHSDVSATKSPGPSATDHNSDGAGQRVPKAFLGTWKGDLTTDSGAPGGELTITIRQGKPGDRVGSGRVELLVLRCDSSWKLVSATSTKLVLDSRIKKDERQTGCSTGSSDERFTLASNGSLRYETADEEGGNPSGTLRKVN
ncbi:MAG: serine/threonine protein kinase, partial [Streptomyces sp.]|nr:serine/threonine protein kinase [Streptomyces sp.]